MGILILEFQHQYHKIDRYTDPENRQGTFRRYILRFVTTYINDGYTIVYYDLLAYALEYPSALISYTRKDVNYTNMNAESFTDDIENILYADWFRKLFHFQIVDLNRPVKCGYR